jgi:hypothetical protein
MLSEARKTRLAEYFASLAAHADLQVLASDEMWRRRTLVLREPQDERKGPDSPANDG